jgi:hypothetical protein
MKYIKHRNLKQLIRHMLSAPFIYGIVFPIVFLDLCLEVYHRVCFKLYDIQYIDRSKHIRIDRHKLKYLNPLQKINCAYCGYANGLFNYATEIAGETEKYWCGIQHQKDKNFNSPTHHTDFIEYNNSEEFHKLKNKK